jgi:hypothetical protein
MLYCAVSLSASAYAKYESLFGIFTPCQFYEIGEAFFFAVFLRHYHFVTDQRPTKNIQTTRSRCSLEITEVTEENRQGLFSVATVVLKYHG